MKRVKLNTNMMNDIFQVPSTKIIIQNHIKDMNPPQTGDIVNHLKDKNDNQTGKAEATV